MLLGLSVDQIGDSSECSPAVRVALSGLGQGADEGEEVIVGRGR